MCSQTMRDFQPGESQVKGEQNEALFRLVWAVVPVPPVATNQTTGSTRPEWRTLAQDWARLLRVSIREISLDDQVTEDESWPKAYQPDDLFICGPHVPPLYKKNVLREALRKGAPALMLTSPNAVLPTRVLLIDQGGPGADHLIGLTAKLCVMARAGLVALTVARTEREARQRQRQAREMLQGWNLLVNFDFLAGAEVWSAVASVARWRRCQLVVMESGHANPWGRWLGSAPGPWVMELLENLSFLLVPTMKSTAQTSNASATAPVPPVHPRRPSLTSTLPRGGPLVTGRPAEPSHQPEA